MAQPDDVEEVVDATRRVLDTPVTLERVLSGGTHATSVVVSDGRRSLVARRFPAGDDAARREVSVYPQIAPLGDLVPRLVATGGSDERPVIVTTLVAGSAPGPALQPTSMAVAMAAVLARVHALPGTGLRREPVAPPSSAGPLGPRARVEFGDLDAASVC